MTLRIDFSPTANDTWIKPSEAIEVDFIPDSIQIYLDIACVLFFTIFSGFGVMSNILNFVVFAKTGVKDCMSICLVSLTVSDFCTAAMLLAYGIVQALITAGFKFYLDLASIQVYSQWILAFFYDITMFHTSFISLERCLCVLFPFHFKNIFTFQRAVVVVISMYILSVLLYLPVFLTSGFSEQFDTETNTTRIQLTYSANRRYLENVYNIYETMTMNFLNLVAVFLCTMGMVVGLRRTSKLLANNASTDTTMSRKKMAIVKMVSILAVIYIVCTCCRAIALAPRVANTKIAPYYVHRNTYRTCVMLSLFSGAVNSSVNIFVYYHYKPMFKEYLLDMLAIKRIDSATG